MKKILFSVLILLYSLGLHAQSTRSERVHELKVTYITDKVKLSSSQTEQFWPLYNQYEKDLKTLRKNYMDEYRRHKDKSLTEDEARKHIEANLDYQEGLVQLKRKYKEDFLKIISARQLAELYTAEREFRQILIQRLRERKQGKRP